MGIIRTVLGRGEKTDPQPHSDSRVVVLPGGDVDGIENLKRDWSSIGMGGATFADLGFGQEINGNEGHGQETLLAAILNAVASDVANTTYFVMKARQLGSNEDVSKNNYYCHAFNVAFNQSMHAVLGRSFISLLLDLNGEVFLQELPGPGGFNTLSPMYDRKISVVKAPPGKFNADGSRAIIGGYIERNLQGIETGRYDSNGDAVDGTALGHLHRIHYGIVGDPFKPQPFVANAAIPISTVHYANLAIRALMSNLGVPGAVVNILDEDIPADELELYERRLNARFSDPTTKGKIVVFGTDSKYQSLLTTAPGAGWADLQAVPRQDAMSTWYMPPSRLGIGGSRTYENQRVELAAYFKNMIMARLTLISSALSVYTRTKGFELYFEANDVPELAEDTQYKLDRSMQLWESNAIPRDQMLGIMGMPPVGGELGAQYYSDTQPAPAPTLPTAVPGTAVGASVGPTETRGGGSPPLVEAPKKAPHVLAVGLDKAIDGQIAAVGAFAQQHNTRVYKRVAGAIKNHANVTDNKLDTPLPATLTASDVFQKSQFDQDLKKDLKPVLTAAAALALPAFAEYYNDGSIATSGVAHAAAEDAGSRLVSGTDQVVSWNDAIDRDLITTLSTAKDDGASVAQTLLRVADTLGVNIGDGYTAVEDQPMGTRAALIAGNASHQMTNTMAHDLMTQRGVQQKAWQSMEDDRVRPTHEDADDTYSMSPIPVDQPFLVGGEQLMYPGDPQGSPAETYNCRCVVIPGPTQPVVAPSGDA